MLERMTINFRQATQSDIEYMAENSINKAVDRKQLDVIDYVYTLEDKIPLLVGGFRMITPTTAWCWIDVSKDGRKRIVKSYRVIKEWIDKFAKNHEIKRLQAFIRTDYPEAIRLIEHLGFEKESTMKDFFGDSSAYMYVRLI